MSPSPQSASPFLDAESFEIDSEDETAVQSLASPFIQRFALEAPDDEYEPAEGSRNLLLAELDNEEFDSAVYELAGEGARAVRHLTDTRAANATLELTFAPLAREIDTSLCRARDHFGARNISSINEAELELVFGERSETGLSPNMENFLGVLKRAVKGAVSLAGKGIALAAKLGLGPILERIRKAIPGVLKKIVQSVIKRLPESLQEPARQLAAGLHIPVEGELDSEGESDIAFDAHSIQSEFNEQVADALLSESVDENEAEYESDWRYNSNEVGIGINELDSAREQFVGELARLQDGEDPTPAVERFIPALLPVLTIAKKLIGRPKIVSLLSGMVAKLIGRFVGPPSTKALSNALVDSGLKLIGFEIAPEAEGRSAHAAIAATVEETVRRVGALSDDELSDRQQAEGAILREFERSAAANFPPLLPSRVYRQRPDLLETDRRRGVWIQCPPAHTRKRFKKYTHVFRTRITPRMAMVIPTFGGATLSAFLNEQLGADPGEELEAEMHLYEAMPGMLLSEITDQESGSDGQRGEYDFHPLTSEAASLLIGEPGLGQEFEHAAASQRNVKVGQRFYRLAIPGRRVVGVTPGRRRPRTKLHLTVDTVKNVVTVRYMLGEKRAQEMSVALRNKAQAPALLARIRPHFERMLRHALSGQPDAHIRILHASIKPAAARGPALRHVPPATLNAFATALANSAMGGLSTFVQTKTAQFIKATEDVKDGVTLRITVTNAHGLHAVSRALSGASPSNVSTVSGRAHSALAVTVDVFPGQHHG